ncbi:hypothetical protein ABB37_04559 [Leptomonas pyrrhocoris]|uniref:Uncharacterized protein n=1 Tax=Leptomonas pyrrhocoris TaxID=157538 RepID=A0A0M9G1H5_LEPPY|nr:hypothetical protein ABB37_04559 [Leptomonas pyrrhocoris]KPA80259.1 hypothetical protein ABB37_04559 [Leptomonas pyrrhocoris]|eukprot:XP_015658698.1 hypothetical protein ABB37_04559 [Leptomonas pyrrhocoris]
MRRPVPGRRLLSRICARNSSPFILSIGGGPPGSTVPTSTHSTTLSNSTLPTFTENIYEMTDFEKDFIIRCYEDLCLHGDSEPSPACSAALQMPTGPLLSSAMADNTQTTWRPFFDLVMLPDGAVCLGWFRCHPLDSVWIRHTKEYVADLWQKAPASLWLMHQERLKVLAYAKLQHRQRHLLVFKSGAEVKTSEVAEAFQLAVRAIHATSRHTVPLEDTLLQLCAGHRMTLMDTHSLLEQVAVQKETLSTGSATALLRMFVTAYALCGSSQDTALVEELRTAARRVCELSRDSAAHILLTWAAALLGGGAASSAVVASAPEPCDETSTALLAALRSSISPSAAHRNAVLCDQVEECISPLYNTLVAEEVYILDALALESRDLVNSMDVAAAAAAAASTSAAADASFSVNLKPELGERLDSSYFSAVLQRGRGWTVEDKKALVSSIKRQDVCVTPLAWVSGTGVDVRGCWCVAFTHSTLLSAQLQLQRRYCSDGTVAACAKTMADAHHVLWVSLIRRCSYITTAANIWSQYSILTHLASTAVQPPVSVTLLHLTNTNADDEVVGNSADSAPLLLGLLFLFPNLELRSFYGGTASQFCTALSAGTRSFPCHLEMTVGSSSAPDARVETVHVPEKLSSTLLEQLEGRSAAVVCFVQSGLAVKDVFELEKLSAHLRHIVLD